MITLNNSTTMNSITTYKKNQFQRLFGEIWNQTAHMANTILHSMDITHELTILEKADLSIGTNVIIILLNSTLKYGPSMMKLVLKILWLKIKLESKCTQKPFETGLGRHHLTSQDMI